MKKFKIRYRAGDNYYTKLIEAENAIEAQAKFYLSVNCYDIICSVDDVSKGGK